MDLMQSQEQDAIQETVRSFLGKQLSLEKTRRWAEGDAAEGLDDVWREAGSLGFFALALEETAGGSGFSLTEEMILFNELGRSLAPGPWLGSVLAARVLGGAERAAVVDGSLPCALVTIRDADRFEVEGGRVRAQLSQVADAASARALLVYDAADWYLVRRDASWEIASQRSLDPTRVLSSLTCDSECAVVARGESARSLALTATILSCAEAVGGIERTVEMSVEYGKVREQFGQPIGSFQAVKHRCADMAVRAEVARSATIYATIALRDGVANAAHHVAVAKLLCADAYLQNGADNIQNHGGMGFTWECDAHLYMKRAHGFDHAFGPRATQLEALVAELRA